MASIFLFLWIKLGIAGIGEFATYATILAPIVMFSQFRYIEYINSANTYQDKVNRFFNALLSSQTVLSVLLIILYVFFALTYESILIILFAGLYKFFELFTDIYVAFLVSVEDVRKAFKVVFLRLFFITTSLVILFFIDLNINLILSVYCLLFIVYCLCFFYDSLIFSKIKSSENSKIFIYIKNNFLYGFNSLLISLNSLAPRYFFIYFNDKNGLGLFTIVYLMASTSTTLMQFLISTKVRFIEDFINKNYKKYFIINFFIALFCIVSYLLISVVESKLYLFIFYYLIMLISLLLRGVNLTAAVSKNMKYIMNFSLIFPVFAVSLFLVGWCYFFNTFNLQLAILYVFLSSIITSFTIVYFIKREIRIC